MNLQGKIGNFYRDLSVVDFRMQNVQESKVRIIRLLVSEQQGTRLRNEIYKNSTYYNLRFILIIAGLVITFNLCSNIMGSVVIAIALRGYHISFTCGVIAFCLAFFFVDIFTNQYGASYAKQLSVGIALCNFTAGLTLYLLIKLPVAANVAQGTLIYEHSLDPMIKGFFAGTIAALTAFYTNSVIFSKLFVYFQGKYLWLRCVGATSLGELIYSSVFVSIMQHNTHTASEIFTLVIDNYGLKFIFEIVTLPLTYFLVYLLAKYEHRIPAKYNTFNPELFS